MAWGLGENKYDVDKILKRGEEVVKKTLQEQVHHQVNYLDKESIPTIDVLTWKLELKNKKHKWMNVFQHSSNKILNCKRQVRELIYGQRSLKPRQ